MDYEKAYKKALERARDLVSKDNVEVAEYIFPELAELNDEKIRKWLIDTIKSVPNDSIEWDVIDKSDVLDWLEKQEKKESELRYKYLEELLAADDIYQMSMDDAMVEQAKKKAINALAKMSIGKLLLENQGEQKPIIEMKSAKESLCISPEEYNNFLNKFYGKQKPACNEENEKMWALIKRYAHYSISDFALIQNHITRQELENWLEKQGNKIWTDNDYDRVKSIEYLLHKLDNHNFDNWFNSLKERIEE